MSKSNPRDHIPELKGKIKPMDFILPYSLPILSRQGVMPAPYTTAYRKTHHFDLNDLEN